MGSETTARWGIVAADRDRPDTYVEVVAFPDHAAAMRNSEHPVTTDFAMQLQEVTEGEAGFRNLDVAWVLRMQQLSARCPAAAAMFHVERGAAGRWCRRG